jgi:hypothetical protein
MAEATSFKVGNAVIGIKHLPRQWIAADCVDGVIPARSGFFGGHSRVTLDFEVGVLWAETGFAPRQSDVDIETFKDKDTKGATYGIKLEVRQESSFDRIGIHAVNFHIYVLGRDAEQSVAHATAYQKSATASFAQNLGDLLCGFSLVFWNVFKNAQKK